MTTFKAAIIGAGRIGMQLESDALRPKPATHAGMWLGQDGIELVALCDRAPAAKEAGARMAPDARFYDDAVQMLQTERPDVVSIATHPDTHVPLGRLCVARGVRLLIVEKPIALDLDDAQAFIAEAEEAGVHVIVNHARRFDPTVGRLKRELAEGIIGDVLQASFTYVYGLVSTATHAVDTLRFLLTASHGEIEWAAAWPHAFDTFKPPHEGNIDGVMCFRSGLKVMVQSLDMKSYDVMDFVLHGTKGKVVLGELGRQVSVYPVVPSAIHAGFTELSPDPSVRYGDAPPSYFGALGIHAYDVLAGRAEPLATGRDSVIARKVLHAMEESADVGGRVVRVKA